MTTYPAHLRCACCGAEMTPAEAMPAPAGASLHYHARFETCRDVVMAQHWGRRAEQDSRSSAQTEGELGL